MAEPLIDFDHHTAKASQIAVAHGVQIGLEHLYRFVSSTMPIGEEQRELSMILDTARDRAKELHAKLADSDSHVEAQKALNARLRDAEAVERAAARATGAG